MLTFTADFDSIVVGMQSGASQRGVTFAITAAAMRKLRTSTLG